MERAPERLRCSESYQSLNIWSLVSHQDSQGKEIGLVTGELMVQILGWVMSLGSLEQGNQTPAAHCASWAWAVCAHYWCDFFCQLSPWLLSQPTVLLQRIMLRAVGSTKKPGKSQKARLRSIPNALRKIHIDEEVKIAMNLSLERFCYSDQKGLFSDCFASLNIL